MREILFKGKRKDNGEWVYGAFVNARDIIDDQQKSYIIWEAEYFTHGEFACVEEVFLETVGQYTGLCDKNGTKIFEGDIVRVVGNKNNHDWKFVNYSAQIVYLDGGFCAFDGTFDDYSMRRYGLHREEFDLEVIGNIHDNKNLLEVEL